MLKETRQLLETMNSSLNAITGLSDDNLQSIQEAIQIISDAIAKLKSVIVAGTFDSNADEIFFFKQVKPQFDGKLIFYLILLRIHTCLVSTDPSDRHSAFIRETEKIQPFYKKHYSLWQYYRMDHKYLDEHYFLRNARNAMLFFQEDHIHYDWQFNTLMSATVARLYAYDLLKEHIARQRERSHLAIPSNTSGQKDVFTLTWTASQIAITELIYALHEYCVFNNGKVAIKKITDYFSHVFNIKIPNIYKNWEDIRLRKKNPFPFIDGLKEAGIRRRDRDNEHAM